MSISNTIVTKIKSLIRSSISPEKFNEEIKKYNLPIDEKFNSLIDVCRKTGRKDLVEILLKFRYLDENIHNVSLLTSAFFDPTLSMENLNFIKKSLDYSSFTLVIHEIIEADESEEALLAAHKAVQIFGAQKHELIKSLIEFAQERHNVFLENFLWNLFEEVAPYAEYPSWVSDFGLTSPPEITNPYNLEMISNITSDPNLSAEKILEKFKELGIEFEDEEEALVYLKNKLKTTLKTDLDVNNNIISLFNKKLIEELYYDKNIFRWFGPDNPTPSSSERMFESFLYDYDDETDLINDWYTGFCNFCHLKIRRRVHSLRIPMPSGGWMGCYCSFDCLRKGIANYDYEDKEYHILIHVMANILEDEIRTIGIQDREDSEIKIGDCY